MPCSKQYYNRSASQLAKLLCKQYHTTRESNLQIYPPFPAKVQTLHKTERGEESKARCIIFLWRTYQILTCLLPQPYFVSARCLQEKSVQVYQSLQPSALWYGKCSRTRHPYVSLNQTAKTISERKFSDDYWLSIPGRCEQPDFEFEIEATCNTLE